MPETEVTLKKDNRRCWGRNRNLHRCGRTLELNRFFCHDHKYYPLLIVGFLITTFLIPAFLNSYPDKADTASIQRLEKLEIRFSNLIKEIPETHKALKYFSNNDFAKSAEIFDGLSENVSDPDIKEDLQGLALASLYSAGALDQGLDYLCSHYKDFPPGDNRHRFRIHSLIRNLALKTDSYTAKKIALEYREKCNRDDFSPLWVGIPIVFMERIKAGLSIFSAQFTLSDEDRKYLEQEIKSTSENRPDPYIDYALYALGRFDSILSDHPKSSLRPLALYDQAHRGTREEKIQWLTQFIAEYPQNRLFESALSYLILQYRILQQHDRAIELINKYALSEAQIEFVNSQFYEWAQNINNHEAQQRALIELIALTRSEELKREAILRLIRLYAWTGKVEEGMALIEKYGVSKQESNWIYWNDAQAENLYSKGNFSAALVLEKKYKYLFEKNGLPIPYAIETKIQELTEIQELNKNKSDLYIFKLGVFLRDETGRGYFVRHGRNTLAIETFKKLLKNFPDSPYADKSLFLIASSYKRLEKFRDSLASLKDFIDRFPRSNLIDDVYTEIGWHYLFIKNDNKTAYLYLSKVINDYPESNSADNAHWWLGEISIREKNLSRAIFHYQEIIASSIAKRLKPLAIIKLSYTEKLVLYVDSLKRNKLLDSIELLEFENEVIVSEVNSNGRAYKIGFRKGDIIYTINSQEIHSLDHIGNALQDANNNHSVIVKRFENWRPKLIRLVIYN